MKIYLKVYFHFEDHGWLFCMKFAAISSKLVDHLEMSSLTIHKNGKIE